MLTTLRLFQKCAVPPPILRRNIKRTVDSIRLQDSEHIKKADCRVEKEPIKARSGLLKAPRILYGNGADVSVRSDTCTWSTGENRFHTPVAIEKWGAIAFVEQGGEDYA